MSYYKHRPYWNLELNPFHGIVRRYAFSLTAPRISPLTDRSAGVAEAKGCFFCKLSLSRDHHQKGNNVSASLLVKLSDVNARGVLVLTLQNICEDIQEFDQLF